MTFKVGDRVRVLETEELGTVTRIEGDKVWGEFDHSGTGYENSYGLSLVTEEVSPFEQNVRRTTDGIADLLIAKNKAYGDSALNPIRVFSKSDRIEQLNVRIDDKISRIQRGTDFEDEDTERDLIGYLILKLIAKESE